MDPQTSLHQQSPAPPGAASGFWPPWRGTGGISAGTLKLIAILAMAVDHSASAFIEDYYSPLGSLLHFVGRITGPVMFFFIAEGYHHTHDVNRYTLRMALFAAVSYLPFIYFRNGALPTADTWMQFNVIYTLFLGLLVLRARHELKSPWMQWGAILVLLLLSFYGDWGYLGILCILVFDLFRGNFRHQRLAYCVVVLGTKVLPSLGSALTAVQNGQDPTRYLAQSFVLAGMFLPILLLGFYNGRRGGGGALGGKWFFYAFYPAHLLVLGLLKNLYL